MIVSLAVISLIGIFSHTFSRKKVCKVLPRGNAPLGIPEKARTQGRFSVNSRHVRIELAKHPRRCRSCGGEKKSLPLSRCAWCKKTAPTGG